LQSGTALAAESCRALYPKCWDAQGAPQKDRPTSGRTCRGLYMAQRSGRRASTPLAMYCLSARHRRLAAHVEVDGKSLYSVCARALVPSLLTTPLYQMMLSQPGHTMPAAWCQHRHAACARESSNKHPALPMPPSDAPNGLYIQCCTRRSPGERGSGVEGGPESGHVT
jgi:hypothetical protein